MFGVPSVAMHLPLLGGLTVLPLLQGPSNKDMQIVGSCQLFLAFWDRLSQLIGMKSGLDHRWWADLLDFQGGIDVSLR